MKCMKGEVRVIKKEAGTVKVKFWYDKIEKHPKTKIFLYYCPIVYLCSSGQPILYYHNSCSTELYKIGYNLTRRRQIFTECIHLLN